MDGSAVRDALAVDEAGLARAAAAGDGGAFGALYRRYEGRVFNLAYRISGSEEIAVEAVQRAFRGVMRRSPSKPSSGHSAASCGVDRCRPSGSSSLVPSS